jgi:hypothetical protein
MKSLLLTADINHAEELGKLELTNEVLDLISGGLMPKHCSDCADVTSVSDGSTTSSSVDCVPC